MSKRKTKEEFIRQANEIHNNKFNYDNVDYVRTSTKVIIGCPMHGEFMQKPYSHLRGRGCAKCALDVVPELIEKFKKIHNNFYSYDNINYKLYNELINITCPIHGDFEQLPVSSQEGTWLQRVSERRELF